MISGARWQHEFVEYIPAEPQEGVLYLSISFATAVHKCACGCGHEVVTPLSPTDWQLIFDGRTVSLQPSIGNWNFPCRSHYWIVRNTVRWAPRMSRKEIDAGRRQDLRAKERYFDQAEVGEVLPPAEPEASAAVATSPASLSFWQKIKRRLFAVL